VVNAYAVRPFFAEFPKLSSVFAPLLSASPGLAALGRFPTVEELNAEARRLDLKTGDGRALVFVDAPPRGRRRRRKDPSALPYERRVAERGEVETRASSWHDFFNGLTWTAFPELKAALNRRQIEAAAEGVVRTREQDRLAIFDEGGVLRAKAGDHVDHFVVGHALYESLVEGKAGIRALVLDVELPVAASVLDVAERMRLAQREAAARIAAGCFADCGVVWPDCLLDEVAK
jgi:hypothetical protein